MFGLGTIINTVAVIAGSAIGMVIQGGLKQRFQDTLMQALGLATIFIGASGAMTGMLSVNNGSIESGGSYLLIFSLVFGAIIGEAINIELRMEQLGEWLQEKVKSKDGNKFIEGFVTSSLVICIGAMAIVGAIQDGLVGDSSTLIAKSLLDFVIVMIFASTYGLGVMFSALPIFVYEGLMTICASLISPIFTDSAIAALSFVGSVLIFGVGINICFGKKIKVGNLLPALFIPVIYCLFF